MQANYAPQPMELVADNSTPNLILKKIHHESKDRSTHLPDAGLLPQALLLVFLFHRTATALYKHFNKFRQRHLQIACKTL